MRPPLAASLAPLRLTMHLPSLRLLPMFALLIACGGDLPDEHQHDDASPDMAEDASPDLQSDMAEDASPDLAEDLAPDMSEDLSPEYDLPALPPVERPAYTQDDALRLNHVSMRCTHNSYHLIPDRVLFDEHGFSHAPLIEQAEQLGVRAFELDVQPGEGFPVHHIPGIDPKTTCATLHECLSQLAHWSAARPGHHLMIVWIELKDEVGARKIRDYDGLDATIRAVFSPERLFVPDDLLRGHATIRDALAADGWPTLGQTRDKFMFAMINSGDRHKLGYLRPDGSLSGRILHLRARSSELAAPWAAIAKIDDPGEVDAIQAALDAGLLVASNLGLAKYDDATNVARRQAGLDIGVHMRCDDYPAPVPERPSWLEIGPGAPTLCNPVSAPDGCDATHIEALGVHDAP